LVVEAVTVFSLILFPLIVSDSSSSLSAAVSSVGRLFPLILSPSSALSSNVKLMLAFSEPT
jgi:hypothetical protein